MKFLNILYKIYSFCIALPIFVAITIFVATCVIIAGFLGDTDFIAYHLPKFWSKCAFWLFLIKVKVEGRENIKKEDSYVFLANHQGYYDIFLAYGYLGHNFKWMMKEYLKKIPFVGYACVKSKHISHGRNRHRRQSHLPARRNLWHRQSRTAGPRNSARRHVHDYLPRGHTHLHRQDVSIQARLIHACQ